MNQLMKKEVHKATGNKFETALLQDCFGEMNKLCRFLELHVSADLLQQIVDNCQIDRLRKSKGDKMPEETKEFFLTNVLKNNFSVYRKGEFICTGLFNCLICFHI